MADPSAAQSPVNIIPIVSLVISGLAFLRPNIEAIYRRRFKKPKLQIVCLDRVEAGFTNFGPYVNCHMTFLASNKAVIILKLLCEVTHIDTSEKFSHEFFMFPSSDFPANSHQLARAIVVNEGSSFSSQIQFNSWDKVTKMSELLQEFKNKFDSIYKDIKEEDIPKNLSTLFNEDKFRIINEIEKMRFWKSGKYKLRFLVECTEDCQFDCQDFEFEITAQDEEQYKLNAYQIVYGYFGLPWHFHSKTVQMRGSVLPVKT